MTQLRLRHERSDPIRRQRHKQILRRNKERRRFYWKRLKRKDPNGRPRRQKTVVICKPPVACKPKGFLETLLGDWW